MADRLLTAPQVAEIIGMRTGFVYALTRRGEIPHLRFGRSVRYRADSIDRWSPSRSEAMGDGRVRCGPRPFGAVFQLPPAAGPSFTPACSP